MTTRVLSQAARDLYRAAYPVGPTTGSTMLKLWISRTGLALRDTATKIGCTEPSLRAWASGRRIPTIELARRIEALAKIPIVAWVEPATATEREGER